MSEIAGFTGSVPDVKEVIAIDGCSAAVKASFYFSEAMAIYPITPSTPMAKLADDLAAAGQSNIWGNKPTVTEMQSEAGAAGTVHGIMSAGALSSTFTASQGLLLMIPNIYKCVGEHLPAVFHISARTIATTALTIYGDHSDVMATARTGAAILFSRTVQEAHDMAAVAHAAAISAAHPFLNCFDGFRTSHAIEALQVIPKEQLASLVCPEALEKFRYNSMCPLRPDVRGTAQSPEIFFTASEAENTHNAEVFTAIERVFGLLEKATGRKYAAYEYDGAADATDVVVVMASGAVTVAEAAKWINADVSRNNGHKVGVVNVRVYRPFNQEAFMAALPASVRRIAVLDRCKDPLAAREPLFLDVMSAVGNSGRDIDVIGGRFGISSREFYPADAVAVYRNLSSEKPLRVFTTSINDDVTHLSLPTATDVPTLLPEGTASAVIWGLGGDGNVGATKEVSKLLTEHANLFTQNYSAYDAFKAGGVTQSHLRWGKQPIISPYLIKGEASFVSVGAFSYLTRFPRALVRPAAKGATMLVNVPEAYHGSAEQWAEIIHPALRHAIAERDIKLYFIDASAVAAKAGLPFINVAMETAMMRLLGIFTPEVATELIKKSIVKLYSKKGQEIVDKNCLCVDLAGDGVHAIAYDHDSWLHADVNNHDDAFFVAQRKHPLPPRPGVVERNNERSEWALDIHDPIALQEGDDIPVSSFVKHGSQNIPAGAAALVKRGVAVKLPAWQSDSCIQCGICAFVCPHAVIRPYFIEEADAAKLTGTTAAATGKEWQGTDRRFRVQIAPYECTGCGLCMNSCPTKAKGTLKMVGATDALYAEEQHNFEICEATDSVEQATERLSKNTIKGAASRFPYFQFSGACPGCSESANIKVLNQLFGDHMIIAGATGCESIISSSYPLNAYAADKRGRGPAWANSLFEDSAEYGLGMLLAMNYRRQAALRQAQKLVECEKTDAGLAGLLKQWIEKFDCIEGSNLYADKIREYLAAKPELLECCCVKEFATPSNLDVLGKLSQWVIMGDGAAYDIGFGGLDAVMASGEDINVLVVSTEVYSNTGGQRSKATPISAVHPFSAAGKLQPPKDLAAMMMDVPNVYVAQVAQNANQMQFLKALLEAEAHKGPSIVISYCPCIEHGIRGGLGNHGEAQKAAVACGMWNLFRYNPDLEEGENAQNPLSIDSKAPSKSPLDFLATQNRFGMLTRANPERAQELHNILARDVARRWRALVARRDGWISPAQLDATVASILLPSQCSEAK